MVPLTKDRIWNIVTFVSVIIALLIAEQTKSALLVVGSITLVPYICFRFNKVTYSAEGVFVSSNGEDLSARLPKRLGMILCITLIAISATFTSLPNFLPHRFIVPSFAMLIFIIPFLYFMVINCPISILCNKNSYQKEVSGIVPSAHSSFYNSKERQVAIDRRCSASYSMLVGNAFHRDHKGR